jgi:hypothetical protein
MVSGERGREGKFIPDQAYTIRRQIRHRAIAYQAPRQLLPPV